MTQDTIATKRTAEVDTDRKKRKSMYKKSQLKHVKLDSTDALVGKKGFLVGFNSGRKTYAKSELFSLIIDAADQLEWEYDEVNVPFEILDCGIQSLLFCAMEWDPIPLADKIYELVGTQKKRYVQNIMKFIPCQVFPANMDTLIELSTSQLKDVNGTFAVGFHSKCCEKFKEQHKRKVQLADAILSDINGTYEIKQKDYQEQLKVKLEKQNKTYKLPEVDMEEMVTLPKTEGPLRVNLTDPAKWVCVDVFKTVACFAILDHFRRFRKYNLGQVSKEGLLE